MQRTPAVSSRSWPAAAWLGGLLVAAAGVWVFRGALSYFFSAVGAPMALLLALAALAVALAVCLAASDVMGTRSGPHPGSHSRPGVRCPQPPQSVAQTPTRGPGAWPWPSSRC